ncbi:hypothetical protein [Microbulbifer aggregans]|uniref:hypothetical protein n=1 Tax=Microbulbifer aggregans TaxID=1769779 RepID=UPI001CFD2091|nr:hypothetical protein [Microbulbifer aggregans]
MINRREQQSRKDTRQVHIRVAGSVLEAFDRYAREVAKDRHRTSVSRSITFERLVTDAKKAGIIT